jgi:UDP-D-galactose:(glucosyl)LPS alpha-1,3-D-galactosyltransferase
MCFQRLPIDRSQLRDLPPGQHGSDAVYARLILPELLPDVPAVVYLDSDILFFRDIAEFWRLPLGGCAAIVCKDEILRCLGNDSPAPDAERAGEPYFNSGLMLIDLDYWRRHGVVRQAIEFLARHGNACRFWDQTALNALLVGKVRYADARWNRFAMTDPEVFLADRFNVHLVARNKPWLQPSEDFYPQLWYLIYHAIMDRKWTFA